MKVFISFSYKDKEIADKVSDMLNHADIEVIRMDHAVSSADIVITSAIRTALQSADIVLAILTDNFMGSSWAQAELGAAILGSDKLKVLPIVVGDILLPSYLNTYLYYKVQNVDEIQPPVILSALKRAFDDTTDKDSVKSETEINQESNLDSQIDILKQALNDNRLSLVCGAGVSIGIGIPSWQELLTRILSKYINNPDDKKEIDLGELQGKLPSSALILGNYLKYLFRDDFETVVCDSLYGDGITLGEAAFSETNLLKSIIELIRPQRNRGSVESVITFNFDSMLEEALVRHSIKHKSIYDEAMKYSSNELPIFHVHGYLPRNERIRNSNLVLSEDAYHTQFSDPYSWSNYVQLYKYSNNVCLFLGLSLTDPNLRRLLDISKRRNANSINHFVVKKMPDKTSKIDEIAMMLEEQDANMLGLNIIWVKDFSDIPTILDRI